MKEVTFNGSFRYSEENFDELTDEEARSMAEDAVQRNPQLLQSSVEDVEPEK
jgi:hypothetical protein